MALYHRTKGIDAIHYGSRAIAVIYYGAHKVWEAIKSCFGKGFWMNDYPWNNTDVWRNNK